MHVLLRCGLLFCPAEFRRQYAQEIAADYREPTLGTAFDLAVTGVTLRLEAVWRDLAFGARSLKKSPSFVAVAVVAIALGIAANVAAGTLIEAMLLKPLPFVQSDRLVFVFDTDRGSEENTVSYLNAEALKDGNRTFAAMSVLEQTGGILTGYGRPRSVVGARIGADYFSLLGARAAIGRLLGASDLGTRHVVISDELWHSRFDGEKAVLGRTLTVNDDSYTIVGVAPPKLRNPTPDWMMVADYWVAVDPHAILADPSSRQDDDFILLGRLAPNVSLAQARNDLARIAGQLAVRFPHADRGHGVDVVSMIDAMLGPETGLLFILYGAAVIVLLIAGANVANLLLARGASREYEFAVRSALGATRARIAAQLTAETGLLTVLGCIGGVAIGWLALRWLHDVILRMLPPGFNREIPGWNHLTIDPWLLGYVAALAVGFTVLVGLVPALFAKRNPAAVLGAGGRGGDVSRASRSRTALVVAEIVLAFTLLVGCGLLVRSFVAVEHVALGYDTSGVYAVDVGSLPRKRYDSEPNRQLFAERLVQQLRAIPAIEGVARVLYEPVSSNEEGKYLVLGRSPSDELPVVEYNFVAPGYFELMRIPLLRGRLVLRTDGARSEQVAIVSESFARREFGSLDAIGRDVSFDGGSARRIVGVVADTRGSATAPLDPEIYLPIAQTNSVGEFLVRVRRGHPEAGNAIYAAVGRVDPHLPPPQIMSLAQVRAFSETPNSMGAVMLTALACAALILALSGIYGIVAFSVERRTHEFGIRMAVGASKRSVVSSVLRGALASTLAGIAIGFVAGRSAAARTGRLPVPDGNVRSTHLCSSHHLAAHVHARRGARPRVARDQRPAVRGAAVSVMARLTSRVSSPVGAYSPCSLSRSLRLSAAARGSTPHWVHPQREHSPW